MAVLFDLDGTLTDPKQGIVRSILYALDRMGAIMPNENELDWCIGPPIRSSFMRLLDTDDVEVIEVAVRLYRERFSQIGLFENAVYPGIPETLTRLREEDIRLFVATSKPYVFAKRILFHFDLARFFSGMYGSELDGRVSRKGDLIALLLRTEGLSPSETIMIGDREHDVVGARENGVPCLGVTYGYGTDEELDQAGAAALCNRPSMIPETILTMRTTFGLSCDWT